MRDSFQDTVEAIFHYKAHRDMIIRRAVISLIPTIAQYDNQVFSDRFLHKAMAHLLEQLEKPADRTIGMCCLPFPSNGQITTYSFSLRSYRACFRCRWQQYEALLEPSDDQHQTSLASAGVCRIHCFFTTCCILYE